MALTIKPQFANIKIAFNGSGLPLGQRSQADLKLLLILSYTANRADYVAMFVSPPTLNELLGNAPGDSNVQRSWVVMGSGQSVDVGVGPGYQIPYSIWDEFNDRPQAFKEQFERVYILNAQTGNYEKLLEVVNGQGSSDPNVIIPLPQYSFPAPYTTFGVEFAIAWEFVNSNSTDLLFINKLSKDSAEIADFLKTSSVNHFNVSVNWYTWVQQRLALADAWLASRGYTPINLGIVFIQGESDKLHTQADYAAKQETLFSDMLADGILDADSKVVLAQIHPESASYSAAIAQAKTDYVTAHPQARMIRYIPSFNMRNVSIPSNEDGVHLNAKGMLQLGFDAFSAFFGTPRRLVLDRPLPAGYPASVRASYPLTEAAGDFKSVFGDLPLARVGNVTIGAGKNGSAVYFDNVSSLQYLQGIRSPEYSLQYTGTTIIGWAKISSNVAITTLMDKGGENSNDNIGGFNSQEWVLYSYLPDSEVHFTYSSNDGSSWDKNIAVDFPPDEWFMYAVVYNPANGGSVSLSINAGSAVSTPSGTPYVGRGIFRIGYPKVGNLGMQGGMSCPEFYNRAWNDAEILAEYNGGAGKTRL